MLARGQFTIGSIMVLTALIALLIHPESWTTIAISELVVVYFVVQTLTTNLPSAIRKGINRNCIRNDSSFSSGRANAEQAAVRKLKSEVLLTVILILVPTNCLLWYLYKEGIPLSKEAFHPDPENQIRLFLRDWTLVIGGALWMVIAFGIIASSYLHALKELDSSIKIRAQQYKIRDFRARQENPATPNQTSENKAFQEEFSGQ